MIFYHCDVLTCNVILTLPFFILIFSYYLFNLYMLIKIFVLLGIKYLIFITLMQTEVLSIGLIALLYIVFSYVFLLWVGKQVPSHKAKSSKKEIENVIKVEPVSANNETQEELEKFKHSKDEEFEISEKIIETIDTQERVKFLTKCCNDYFWKRITLGKLGKFYERYVGYNYYEKGYKNIEYFGIKKKMEDEGIDLICKKQNEVLLIQCKYWSEERKMQGENAIHQFYGKLKLFLSRRKLYGKIQGVFICNCDFTEEAIMVAKFHNIVLVNMEMPKNRVYPYAKCFEVESKKYYTLPFDINYDRIFNYSYNTIEEAEILGYKKVKSD